VDIRILITTYVATAAFVMVWVLFGAVVNRRPIKLFSFGEQVVLVVACIAVGLL
jgi:hypothetical protein